MSSDNNSAWHASGVDAREIHILETGEGALRPPPVPDLPRAYGQDRLTLLPRDPDTLFASWELTGGGRERVRARLQQEHHPARLTLRLLELGGEAPRVVDEFDVEGAHSWYIHARRPGALLQAQLGLKAGVFFIPIVTSGPVPVPTGRESDTIDAEWLTIEEILERTRRLHFSTQPGTSPGLNVSSPSRPFGGVD